MKTIRTCVVLLLFGLVSVVAVPADDIYSWETDLDTALSRARELDRSVLVYFAGSDWCGWCARFHTEIVYTDLFRDFTDRFVVPVLIDFPRIRELTPEQQRANEQLAARFGVRGFPTVLILDPDGSERFRTGFLAGGAGNYVAHLLPHVRR